MCVVVTPSNKFSFLEIFLNQVFFWQFYPFPYNIKTQNNSYNDNSMKKKMLKSKLFIHTK